MVQQVCAMCRLMAEVKIMPVVESLNDFACLSEDFYQDLKRPSVSKRIKWRGLLRKINSNQQKLARMIFVQLIQRVNPEIAYELERVSQICCMCGLIDNTTAGDPQNDQIKFMSLQFPKTTRTWEPLRRSKSLDILIEYSCSSLEGKPAEALQSQAANEHGAGHIKSIYQRSGFRYEDSRKDSVKSKQSTKVHEYHHKQVNPYHDSFSADDGISPVEVQKNEASTEAKRSDNDDDDFDDDEGDGDGEGEGQADADANADADAEAEATADAYFEAAADAAADVDAGSEAVVGVAATADSHSDGDGADVVDQDSYVDAPERLLKTDSIDHTCEGSTRATHQQHISSEGFSLEKTPIIHGQTIHESAGDMSHIPTGEVRDSDDLQMLPSEDVVPQGQGRVPTNHVGEHTQKTPPGQTQTMLPIPAWSLVWVFLALLVLTVLVVVMHMLPTGLLLAVIALVCIQIYINRND